MCNININNNLLYMSSTWFIRLKLYILAQIAQSVEQRTENPRVGGSIPPLSIICVGNNYDNYKNNKKIEY